LYLTPGGLVVGKQTCRLLLVASIYFVAGKLGLTLAFLHPSATAVWPNSGLALAALLIFGIELWPGVFIGALAVNLLTVDSVAASAAIATGNTLEAVAGAWLVCRFAGGVNAIRRAHDIFRFILLAGIVSTTISATIGVTSLVLAGSAAWSTYWQTWLTWWLGDAAGVVIISPVLLTWAARNGNPRKWNQIRPEAIALLVSVFAIGQIVFGDLFLTGIKKYPLEYLCIPFLAWSAFRFGQRETSVTMLMFAASAIVGTFSGFGPFGRDSLNESLVLMQSFLAVAAALSMVLAAEVADRRRAELSAMSLATTDPLTGLGNYRKFVDSADTEIRRSDRTKRSFALLLLDLDGLKQINDINGHLSGNRALCRLADVIRLNCRSCDITVRYGGDEFAVMMPEADRHTAYRVAGRIRAALAGETEKPSLTVSVGVAVWPIDGTTLETLLETADLDLYAMKNRSSRTHYLRSELA
jgi:diguanylate cyclase (GGDEF)-like protein